MQNSRTASGSSEYLAIQSVTSVEVVDTIASLVKNSATVWIIHDPRVPVKQKPPCLYPIHSIPLLVS
jgi:hypothetical protein